MNIKDFVQILIALVIGFGIGFIVKPSTEPAAPMMHDMHSMTMIDTMGSMTDRLKGKTGVELEQIFLEDMIVHHQGAVDMAKELQRGTNRPELQKMAADIITVQAAEIEMMRNWLKEWFGK